LRDRGKGRRKKRERKEEKKQEEMAISWLVQRIPSFITSNMLTGIGFFGNMIVCASFILASFYSRSFLLLGLIGFAISWFGDSLDGRLAYYRNKPRRKYGFTLDITIDWISIILIGLGYIIYAEGAWKMLGYGFVVLYGWGRRWSAARPRRCAGRPRRAWRGRALD